MHVYREHLMLLRSADVPFIPEHHMVAHMTAEIPRRGNPRFYSTFMEETLNRTIATVANHSHPSRWEERIYQRLDLQGELDPDGRWA